MKRSSFILSAIVLSGALCVMACGQATTRPTVADPPKQPVAADPAKPTVATADKFPSPADLVAKLKSISAQEDRLPKVAFLDLSHSIVEKPGDFSLFGDNDRALTLRNVLDRLEKARKDTGIRAVLITLGDSGMNISQAMEIRNELDQLRRDGKRTFVYADNYDTDTYLAASGATDVCMLAGGDIEIPGVGFELTFLKGTFDKIGVQPDFVQIGEYKGAQEEFTRTSSSPEFKGELNKLADSLYDQIIDTISASRNLSPDAVKQLVDESLITGRIAKQRGLVDHLVDEDGLRPLMADELGQKVNLVQNYGAAAKEQLDLSNPFAVLSLLTKHPEPSTRPTIAIVYAEGVITDGDGDTSLLGTDEGIGSERFRRTIRLAERDDKTEAIVVRIDSPGGSAVASEIMWQALRRIAKDKPVIISIGSEAASGGYYLACGGDYIFADPTALVGSIGVVGGKFVTAGLYKWLGLSSESFLRGRNADLFSSNTPWNDRQRRQVTNWMRDTYDQFTQRVMSTRKDKIKDIDAVARGRIFTAKQAKDLGMVDEIGGIQAAIAYAAEQAALEPGEYDVRVLPAAKTIADLFQSQTGDDDESDDSDSRSPVSPKVNITAALMAALSPREIHVVDQSLEILRVMAHHPVVLATPFVLEAR